MQAIWPSELRNSIYGWQYAVVPKTQQHGDKVAPCVCRGVGVVCPEAQNHLTAELTHHSRCKKKLVATV